MYFYVHSLCTQVNLVLRSPYARVNSTCIVHLHVVAIDFGSRFEGQGLTRSKRAYYDVCIVVPALCAQLCVVPTSEDEPTVDQAASLTHPRNDTACCMFNFGPKLHTYNLLEHTCLYNERIDRWHAQPHQEKDEVLHRYCCRGASGEHLVLCPLFATKREARG